MTNLTGRSMGAALARADGGQHWGLMSSRDIRNANDTIDKFSWLGKTRVGEVTFIDRADLKSGILTTC